ncbi:MAG: PaaI family thioesterase [Clostridiaceae bacterium]|nr:PaaI family thioesterase [Clostridiaceae bacterium]
MELDDIRKIFANDRYATECAGAVIDEAEPGHAQVHCTIEPRHKNAAGGVMGGVVCTLADFAFAIASNLGDMKTVSVNINCSYLGSPRGARLIAQADCVKNGRSVVFYTASVTDDLGNAVAKVEITGFRKS